MSYFIFKKNSENQIGNLYKIAKNKDDLDSINLGHIDNYTIIEDSEQNFNDVRLNLKSIITYSNNKITYENISVNFNKPEHLKEYINKVIKYINDFLKFNENSVKYNLWNSYLIQLKNFNVDNIEFPLNYSLEKYFEENNQISLNILQIP